MSTMSNALMRAVSVLSLVVSPTWLILCYTSSVVTLKLLATERGHDLAESYSFLLAYDFARYGNLANFWPVASICVQQLLEIFLVRFGLVVATLLHEWAHLAAMTYWNCPQRSKFDKEHQSKIHSLLEKPQRLWSHIWTADNVLGNVEVIEWMKVILNPFSPLGENFSPHVIFSSGPSMNRTFPSSASTRQGSPTTTSSINLHNYSSLKSRMANVKRPSHSQLHIGLTDEHAGDVIKDDSGKTFHPYGHVGAAVLSKAQESFIRLSGWAFSVLLCIVLSVIQYRVFTVRQPQLPANSRQPCAEAGIQHPALQSSLHSSWEFTSMPVDHFFLSGWTEVLIGFWICAIGATASDLLGLSIGNSLQSCQSKVSSATSSWQRDSKEVLLVSEDNCSIPHSVAGSCHHIGAVSLSPVFFCGNFGLLMMNATSGVRKRAVDALSVLEKMAAISTERGGQSGGVVTLFHQRLGGSRGVRVRVRPSKRQSLSKLLTWKFRISLVLANIFDYLYSLASSLPFLKDRAGRRPASSSGTKVKQGKAGIIGSGSSSNVRIFAGHTRFATSSIPVVQETHPHQWLPERSVRLWQRHAGYSGTDGSVLLSRRLMNMGIYVTHNGDFEFWNLFGRDRTHSELGPWLEVVLGSRQPAHCDSVMVAGLMDLLRTQGLWAASLRLAFHQTVIMSYEEVFQPSRSPHSAVIPSPSVPSPATLELLAATAERTMNAFVENLQKEDQLAIGSGREKKGLGLTTTQREKLTEMMKQGIKSEGCASLQKLQGLPGQADLLSSLPEETVDVFVAQAVANFLDNDLFWALKKFLSNAKGSFGMSVTCTLDTDRVVLAALNQPLSIGFSSASLSTILYSSESHSLSVPLISPAFHKEKESPSNSHSSDGSHVKFRMDLSEDDGEVVELRMVESAMYKCSGNEEGKQAPITGNGLQREEMRRELDVECGGGEDLGQLKMEEMVEDKEDRDGAIYLPQVPFVQMRIFNVRRASSTSREELEENKRLVAVGGNPYISLMEPNAPSSDLVLQDIEDIPRVLQKIRADWVDETSLNRQSAAALLTMLEEKAAAEVEGAEDEGLEGVNKKEIDVLITAVESSLWVAEQFAADLQNCFPRLRVVPVSANKVIGVMGNARGAISTAGFSFCRITHALSATRAIVIAVSQSGQTFPTLHATRILAKHCHGRVFVCVGMMDSKMSAAVGHSLDPSRPFCRRVFHTHSAWRSAEPASLTAVATHATLTEIMLLVANHLRSVSDAVHSSRNGMSKGGEMKKMGKKPLGLRLSARDLSDLERIRDAVVFRSAEAICGKDGEGASVESSVHGELMRQGHEWALHILETPIAWALSSAYIFGVVISGSPLFISIRRAFHFSDPRVADGFTYAAHILDATLFCFLPLVFALLLRILQRRDLFARIGKRTLVIADVPYVHQVLEIFVSKMFALSFWIASIDVHGANPIDHFVHRFTHRVTRGTLLAVGRPDGRLCSQTKCESWVLMALLQARTIVNLGSGAEVVTVGHNPFVARSVIRNHVVLPSDRPKFLCEQLLGVDDEEPLKRMASRDHAVKGAGGKNLFRDLDGQVIGQHLCDESTVQKARRLGLSILSHGMGEIEEGEENFPMTRDAALSAMDVDVKAVLHSQASLEELSENRFLSLERLLSFQVMFHNMAATVAFVWPINFDISRSQSCLRIATTAAPISAADLEREWLDTISAADFTVHHRRRSNSYLRLSEAAAKYFLPSSSHLHHPPSSLHAPHPPHLPSPRSHSNLFSLFHRSPDASHHSIKSGCSGRVSPDSSLHHRFKEGAEEEMGFSEGWGGSQNGGLRGGYSLHGEGLMPVLDVTPGSSIRGGMMGGVFARGREGDGSVDRNGVAAQFKGGVGLEDEGAPFVVENERRERASHPGQDPCVKGGQTLRVMLEKK